MAFGIRLAEPPPAVQKRKKASIWPTAKEATMQLSLFD